MTHRPGPSISLAGRRRRSARHLSTLFLAFLAGCSGESKAPVYHDDQGFRITPPANWVERARSDANPGASGRGRAIPHQDLPMPPLGAAGQPGQLLVRYDRLTPGQLAWLRVSAVEAPGSVAPATLLTAPGVSWRPEGQAETLEIAGLPAARIAFRGRWDNQDYLSETVAVRKGERVYLLTASFPAADATAREQVRQAIAGATWQ